MKIRKTNSIIFLLGGDKGLPAVQLWQAWVGNKKNSLFF